MQSPRSSSSTSCACDERSAHYSKESVKGMVRPALNAEANESPSTPTHPVNSESDQESVAPPDGAAAADATDPASEMIATLNRNSPPTPPLTFDDNSRTVFNGIYDEKLWKSNVRSGTGSIERHTRGLRPWLITFFVDYHIRIVVDGGCGNWRSDYRHEIDWQNTSYIGINTTPLCVEDSRAFVTNDLMRSCNMNSAEFRNG